MMSSHAFNKNMLRSAACMLCAQVRTYSERLLKMFEAAHETCMLHSSTTLLNVHNVLNNMGLEYSN